MQVVVGRVVKAHGVTGEMVVEVRTDDPRGRFAPGERLQAADPRDRSSRREVVVQTVRDHGARLLLRVVGVDDRDGADALRGALLLVDTAALPPIDDPDEYYDHQLVGLRVCTVSGDAVGTVTDVLHTGAGEVLTVRTGEDAGGAGGPGDSAVGEVLVPFVAAIVTEVRLEDGVITIDPPDGLLDPA